jgi:uncharacterized phage protein (TIGR01671 family)
MREIKFRVRDIKNNKWVDAVPSLEYLLDDGDHSISHHDIDEESGIYTYPKNITGDTFDGRLVWQQFTGLKDYKGADIYEGDILEELINNETAKQIGVCKQILGGWQIFADKSCYHGWKHVIIGNIFDNPELLK